MRNAVIHGPMHSEARHLVAAQERFAMMLLPAAPLFALTQMTSCLIIRWRAFAMAWTKQYAAELEATTKRPKSGISAV